MAEADIPIDGIWPQDVVDKAEKMRSKDVLVRDSFNLPATESVIQDYYCSMERSMTHRGRMWVTQSYICFDSGFPFYATEVVPFWKVTDIKQNPGVIIKNSIDIFEEGGKVHHFHSFMRVDETLIVLRQVWRNPPSYVRLDDDEDDEEDEIGVAKSSKSAWGGGGGETTLNRAKQGGAGGQSEKKKKKLKVNVDGSKRAVRLGHEARAEAVEILAELDRQGEKLDKIEETMDRIHANLDRSERLVRGITSVGGATANLVTLDNTKNRKIPEAILREHAARMEWQNDERAPQLEILLKLQSEAYVEAYIVFKGDKFAIKEKASGKYIAQHAWTYDMVKYLVLRARPLHLDVRFRDQSPRLRLMACCVQAVVNELYLRTLSRRKDILVLFEPNIKPFDYGSYALALHLVPSTKDNPGGATYKAHKQVGTADLLSDDVSEDTKRDVREAEKNMEEVYDLACDLEKIGEIMEKNLVDTTEQMKRIDKKTKAETQRVQGLNTQVRKTIDEI
eukprot:CAMPEP_0119125374 /NCGR_PEP_ID=MMETSP1310-20130426/4671_1 /TAXON_ID=464262 /ORGANISM="Genus nov. species nov., Strain RCC2339" /LENGTH=505 /DNA_ID=CAMNT_0007115435 /DNA_START=145 /DNA_END=1662 /DNA_ORIENTATION=-